MAEFRLTVKGLQGLERRLKNAPLTFRSKIKREMIFAGDDFIELIRSRYYRGRKGKVGLNRISHVLHNSWKAIPIEQGDNISMIITPENVKYAIFHEFSSKIHDQRTFVRRDIKRGEGKKIFTNMIRNVMRQSF